MESADWNRLFKQGIYVHNQPDPSVVEFATRNLSTTSKRRCGLKILDLGCGYGRHMELLLKYGVATVVGLDSSLVALRMAKEKLRRTNATRSYLLIGSDIEQLPFPPNHFDHLISTKVLQHKTLPERRLENIVLEMARVLRRDGSLLVTVASTNHREYGIGRTIARNTFEILEGRHKGVVQHYFEKDELRQLF